MESDKEKKTGENSRCLECVIKQSAHLGFLFCSCKVIKGWLIKMKRADKKTYNHFRLLPDSRKGEFVKDTE